MGGNALKEVSVRRMDKREYLQTEQRVMALLNFVIQDGRARPLPYYDSKDSFGDLDILLNETALNEIGGHEGISSFCYKRLCATQMVGKGAGSTWSANYRSNPSQGTAGFQVDFLTVPDEEMDFALGYLGYNDLGNLMGRTARALGLRLGHNGLWIELGKDTDDYRRVRLTLDFNRAIGFLGYDPGAYKQGFSTMEEIFSFAADSRYFQPGALDVGNSQARKRNAQRPAFTAFKSWVRQNYNRALACDQKVLDERLRQLDEFFPDYERKWKESPGFARYRPVSGHYWQPVERVLALTDMAGKEVGPIMAQMKAPFNDAELFREYVKSLSDSELLFVVAQHQQKMKKSVAAQTSLEP